MKKPIKDKEPRLRIEMGTEDVDWAELAEVYRRAPLGERNPEDLKAAFMASYLVVIARLGSEIVGAGRIISDGVYYANIYDVAIKPEFQSKGVGSLIMRALLAETPTLFKLLTATTGAVGFYEKLGFRKHKTAMAIYPRGKESNAELYLQDLESATSDNPRAP